MNAHLAPLIDAELAKSWRERRGSRLAALYGVQQKTTQRREAKIAVWFVGVLYILFGVADVILIADLVGYAIWGRIAIGIVYALGIALQIKAGVRSSIIELQCAIGVVIGFAAWFILTSFSRNTENVLLYTAYGTVFMMVANLFFNFTPKMALVTSGSIALIFISLAPFLFHTSVAYYAAIGSLYVISFVLTLFVNWKLDAERYRVFLNSLRAEIRQKEAHERGAELLRLSTTDALTGLSNRRATDDLLQELWRKWDSRSVPFGVILVDIDYFKMFNDFYGHQQGDSCLVTVSRAMERVVSDHGGQIGRFGGEEFIVLIAADTSDQVASLAEHLRHAVQALHIKHEARSDHLSVVTVSIGAAFSRDVEAKKAERIVTDADRALYAAKDSNRNCVRLFDSRLAEVADHGDTITALLQTAIENGRVSLVYQPIWNIETGRMVAAEALMRLTAPNGAPISPATFIPVAERTGAIVELGVWAIREACQQLMSCPGIPMISVNVSAVQIAKPTFALNVARIVSETGVASSRLALEITEGSEIDDSPEVLQTISDLAALGVSVWLDDFGTGFAGLSCLSKFSFDTVKIDRLFVQATDTPRGAKLLGDMIRMLSNSGQKIILEGVETKDEVNRVRELGGIALQGYYFNRPMSAEALTLLARKGGQLARSALAA